MQIMQLTKAIKPNLNIVQRRLKLYHAHENC